jgi:putative oxidoreductase
MGIPVPQVSAIVVSLVEFVGGICLILGIGTRWAAILLVINMAVAVLKVHLPAGFFAPRGFEYPLTLLAANLTLALTGPGRPALRR